MVREKSVKSQGISFQTKSGHPEKNNFLLCTLIWGPGLPVHPYLENASSEGSGKSGQISSLAPAFILNNAISTKIS